MKTNLKPSDVTTELIMAVYTYVGKRAIAETMRAEVDKVTTQLLTDIELYSEGNNYRSSKRIFNPSDTWLCRDDEVMETFYTEIDNRLKEVGLKPDDMERDFCPALVAEHEQIKAEWQMLTEVAKMLELDMTGNDLNNQLLCQKDGLNKRREFIDMTVGLVLNLNK